MSEAPSVERTEQLRQLRLLLDLSRQVAALDSLEDVLAAMVGTAILELGAETGSLFVHDDETGELYTQKSSDLGARQIRVMDDLGIAGAVYQSGTGEIVSDAYADPRFAREVDQETGFTTRSILCAPVRNAKGETIGVVEMLNKLDGEFDERDLALLEEMTSQCAITLQSLQLIERMTQSRRREIEFLNVVSELTSELELGRLLGKVMSEATRMLDAERSTLFLQRREDRRAVQLHRRQARDRDPLPEPRRHRRGGVHDRGVDPDPARLRRSALQPGVRPADRLLHALDPLRARSSTRRARRSASRRR